MTTTILAASCLSSHRDFECCRGLLVLLVRLRCLLLDRNHELPRLPSARVGTSCQMTTEAMARVEGWGVAWHTSSRFSRSGPKSTPFDSAISLSWNFVAAADGSVRREKGMLLRGIG